jgi:hypothetical protein
MKKIISTWIYLDSKQEQSKYAQIRGDSSTKKFQANYWRCVVVFFESSLRYNEDAEHILFTNTDGLPEVEGFDIRAFLDRNNIKVVNLANKYPLPQGYYESWRNQFFVFTIIDYLKDYTSEEDKVILLDSDCVFRKPIDEAFELLNEHDAITYVIRYEEKRNIHGINRLQMQDIFADFGLKLDTPPWYSGGEVLFANGKFLKAVAEEFPTIYQNLLERFKKNRVKLNEEAHTLSYFYYKHNAVIGGMNKYIKRLWTNPYIFRTAKEEDRNLYIWHLPKEKKFGIRELFKRISKGQDLQNMPEQQYQELIYKRLFDEKKYNTFSNKVRKMLVDIKQRYLKPAA